MTLGKLSQISIGTSDLEASKAYWTKLGMQKTWEEKTPIPWAQFTDDTILVFLRADGHQYTRLTYFNPEIDSVFAELENSGIAVPNKSNGADGKTERGVFTSPDGLEISVVKRDLNTLYFPTKPTMLTLPQDEMGDPAKMPSPLGVFGEFCHPVKDLKASIAFWEKIGFSQAGVFEHPYPWAIMTDKVSIVGLHQSTHFTQPAITYFAPDMSVRVQKLRDAGIEVKEIGMGPGNVVATTPEGAKLFLFSLG